MSILEIIESNRKQGKKGIAILIDPDELGDLEYRERLDRNLNAADVDFIFVGGSLVKGDGLEENFRWLKSISPKPLVLFPGSINQVNESVDAVLFLSLISGRNPELLIGQHVLAAPKIEELGIEPIPTGYMLIDGGKPTTASYISHTLPIPRDKSEIAVATALAGKMLGMRCIYTDTGSGAMWPVPLDMLKAIRKKVDLPLICGGGIRTVDEAQSAFRAGADIVVIGTLFEESPELIATFSSELRSGFRA